MASCPTTAREHLKNLYNAFNLQSTSWDSGLLADHAVPIEPLIGGTRDKLIAIMQSFSHKAQRIHGLTGSMHETFMTEATAPFPLVLPPLHALDTLLSACLSRYEIYYPFLCAASLKTNMPLDAGSNAVISSLKLLLMLAAGAMTAVTGTTRQIAHGLLEIGRISFCHLIEEDMKLAANPDMLQCALGYIIAAAWCGDKWQMDMLRRSKFFEQRSLPITTTDAPGELENSWQRWQEQESSNRTACTWIILDQEMCLFQDSALTLPVLVPNFNTSVPNPDSIWRATSAGQWTREMARYSRSSTFPPSLNDYFKRFRETPNVKTMTGVTPVILRLLLCHLQGLVGQVRRMIADTSSGSRQFSSARHKSMVLVSAHLDEACELLQKWYTLVKHSCIDDKSPTKSASMILYRLIVLNTLVSFPEVERLAQGEDTSQPSEPSRWNRPYHFDDHRRIYFHCGQIVRTIRGMPEHTRPPWWAGAVYRVALTAWANSMTISDAESLHSGSGQEDTPLVVLDVLPPEHPLIDAYLDNQKGTPVLSTTSGGTVPLDIPGTILTHLASFLGSDPQTDFVKGIRQKLLRLAARWEGHPPT
ncbi:hypothetical protein LTR50_001125 [Elasticomyces elasticus]|nr:hypothetical protein LTR50_001125 [Elasticomyces elasticus]